MSHDKTPAEVQREFRERQKAEKAQAEKERRELERGIDNLIGEATGYGLINSKYLSHEGRLSQLATLKAELTPLFKAKKLATALKDVITSE
jgi:hypothetical protein